MVTVYVGGKAVNWADAEKLFAEAARTQSIEFRDETGCVFATTIPGSQVVPNWTDAITPEETARRMSEPGFTFEEMKKRLGWE